MVLNTNPGLAKELGGGKTFYIKLGQAYFNLFLHKYIGKSQSEIMNYLWSGMILVGIVYAAFHGTLPQVTSAALDSAKDSVTLCITMLGVMSFWMGLMNIATQAGLIVSLTKKMFPVLQFLFPRLPRDHVVNEYLATNMIANIFGLGWAATPAGLKAMEELKKINMENCHLYGENRYRAPDIATKEMCDFLIINISSLQLVPVNIIAYRAEYGSAVPTDIMGAAIAATTLGTVAAILFCKLVPNREKVFRK